MTKQEQIEEMTKLINSKEIYPCEDDVHCENCFCSDKDTAVKLYNAGYRKIDDFEECRKCPAWSGTDCVRNPYTEGCLDDKVNLKNEIKHLNTIVERLDELLGKGINDYIMGIDGVEGIKDMWERSAVREFAEKVKEKYSLYEDRHILYRIIDELLREYE